jgi:hypothetical protein
VFTGAALLVVATIAALFLPAGKGTGGATEGLPADIAALDFPVETETETAVAVSR